MQQLNEAMATPQFVPIDRQPIDRQWEQIGHHCGLKTSEFAIIDNSVLVDGGPMFGRQRDIASTVRRFTEQLLGVTVVLPGDLPFEEVGSLRKQIVAAGGSCYFRSAGETFEQVTELARDRMRRLQLAPEAKVEVAKKRGSADVLKGYTYTPDEQEALRHAYEHEDESGSLLS